MFWNPNGGSGQTPIGTMDGGSTGNVVTPGLTVTINVAF
jgi:hypothetical protein